MSHATHDLGTISGGVSIGSGLVTFFDVNANAIGAMVAVLSFLATIIFLTLNYMLNRRAVLTKESARKQLLDSLIKKATPEEREVLMRVIEQDD